MAVHSLARAAYSLVAVFLSRYLIVFITSWLMKWTKFSIVKKNLKTFNFYY
jgi:hypothetical protein